MAEIVRDFWLGMPLGMYIILILAIGLGVAGFLVPPMGVISGSVLKFVSLILGASWLFYTTANIPAILEAGGKVSAQMGNASITIGRHRKNKEEKTEIEEENTDGFEDTTERDNEDSN